MDQKPVRKYTIEVEVDENTIGAHEIFLAWLEVGNRVLPGGKQVEYAPGADRFENFRDGGNLLGITPEEALLAYSAKHMSPLMRAAGRSDAIYRALMNAWDDINANRFTASSGLMWDKALDLSAYMVLLTGMVASAPTSMGLDDIEGPTKLRFIVSEESVAIDPSQVDGACLRHDQERACD